jgi:hypothetical protein
MAQGVMPGWADGDKGLTVVGSAQGIDGHQPGPGGLASNGPRVRRGVGVGIEIASTPLAEGGQLFEIGDVVHPTQLGQTRGFGLHDLEIGTETKVLDAGHHGPNPFWSFGMSAPNVSHVSGGPADDQHGATDVVNVVAAFRHAASASCSSNKVPIP